MYTATKVNDTKYIINDTHNDYFAVLIGGNWVMFQMSMERVDQTEHDSVNDLINYYENLTAEEYDMYLNEIGKPESTNTAQTEHPSNIVNLLAALGTIEDVLTAEFSINPKELQYNNTLHDEIMIGYFKNDPDGDQQIKLSESNFSMTYQQSRNSLLNRIKNMLDSIDTKEF